MATEVKRGERLAHSHEWLSISKIGNHSYNCPLPWGSLSITTRQGTQLDGIESGVGAVGIESPRQRFA